MGYRIFIKGFIFGIFLLFALGLSRQGAAETVAIPENIPADVIIHLQNSSKLLSADEVLKDFLEEGAATTRVIVNLRKPANASQLSDISRLEVREALTEAVHDTQEAVIDVLDPDDCKITNRFVYIFGFSAEVSLRGLQDLVDNPDVLSIEKDEILHANLAQGIPLMNASTPRSSYNGSGLSIAVCDTGIDYTHPRLGGGGFPNSKVIGGYDCGDDDNNPMDLQGHGTACAGIAAGNTGTVGDYIGGVAYNAKLYALKISYGSSINAYSSDMVEGWEWCITHQNDDPNNPIMIISTSFGGGYYTSTCDTQSTARTAAAVNAVAAGMTLFVASGNEGYCDGMGAPACVSHVISVGAVYDANLGRNPPAGYVGCIKNESCVGSPDTPCDEKGYVDEPANAAQVTTYSDTASFLDLFAPANWATTTKLGGGYWTVANGFGGTSAACPYAAGAAGCLQSAAKTLKGSYLTPAQVRTTLTSTGNLLTDPKAGISKPLVDLSAAVASLQGSGSTLYVNSTGNCSGKTPCYSTLQQAINAANSGDTIKIAGGTLGEDVTLNNGKALKLKGGYNAAYTDQTSKTVLNSMSIRNGSAHVDKLTLAQSSPP
ncbi:MAG: S8 family serine peptidase [Deltaproteobacteria bacterium]|nr:S8 family serine peptidase [Deltaproteobacteria bacterium]